MTLQVNC